MKRSNVLIIIAIMLATNRLILCSVQHPAPPIHKRAVIGQVREDLCNCTVLSLTHLMLALMSEAWRLSSHRLVGDKRPQGQGSCCE